MPCAIHGLPEELNRTRIRSNRPRRRRVGGPQPPIEHQAVSDRGSSPKTARCNAVVETASKRAPPGQKEIEISPKSEEPLLGRKNVRSDQMSPSRAERKRDQIRRAPPGQRESEIRAVEPAGPTRARESPSGPTQRKRASPLGQKEEKSSPWGQ